MRHAGFPSLARLLTSGAAGGIGPNGHLARSDSTGSDSTGNDATRKWGSEGFDREWPEVIVMDEKTKTHIDSIWQKLGI